MHVGADNKRVLTKAKTLMAEDTRFELVRLLHQHAFQACALGLYATSPQQTISLLMANRYF